MVQANELGQTSFLLTTKTATATATTTTTGILANNNSLSLSAILSVSPFFYRTSALQVDHQVRDASRDDELLTLDESESKSERSEIVHTSLGLQLNFLINTLVEFYRVVVV